MICILSGSVLVGFGFFLFLWGKDLLKTVCGILYAILGIALCIIGVTEGRAGSESEIAAVALMAINLGLFSLIVGFGIAKIKSRTMGADR